MKQKEKERSYSEDVCLWQGHWIRPHRTMFVRHIYLCDYKIKYISFLCFENNPCQYSAGLLNNEISDCTHCFRLELQCFISAAKAKL